MDNQWISNGQPLDFEWTTIGFRMDNHWTGIFNFDGGEDHFGTLPDDTWAANCKCQYIQCTRSGNCFPRTNARIQWATSRSLRMDDVPRTLQGLENNHVKMQSQREHFPLLMKSKHLDC